MDSISLLQEISELADPIALKYFNAKNLKVEIKENQTPVSQADQEIETEIRALIRSKNLDLTIIGEEHGHTEGSSDLTLIIDPIDGTKNFILGIPIFGSLFALKKGEELLAGLVSAPALQSKWWAEKGKGAYHNGKKITVSNTDKLSDSLALYGSLFGSEAADNCDRFIELLKKTYRQRGYGDFYPHMLVAQGAAEFAIDFKLNIWDIAPLKIIVEEAGGTFTDTNGSSSIESGTILTSNGQLHNVVLEAVKGMV